MPIIVFTYLCYLILSLKSNEIKNGRPIFLLIIFSFAIAGITGDILKEIFNRARPIIEYSNEIRFFTNPKTPSFPSGHAIKSVAFVIPFLFYAEYKGGFHSWIKGILAFIALMVCFARIFLGAHYLSDVLAGIGWAFLCLPLSVLLSNRILRRMSYKKLNIAAKVWIFIYLGLIFFLFFM
jgi:undecaprenyl-diphosphatase